MAGVALAQLQRRRPKVDPRRHRHGQQPAAGAGLRGDGAAQVSGGPAEVVASAVVVGEVYVREGQQVPEALKSEVGGGGGGGAYARWDVCIRSGPARPPTARATTQIRPAAPPRGATARGLQLKVRSAGIRGGGGAGRSEFKP